MSLPDRISDIHPSIVQAICRVQSGLNGAIKQDGNNKFAGYKYASTDAVYAALTLKLAEAGLSILTVEEHEPEIKRIEVTDEKGKTKVQQWAKFSFGFILATSESTWYDVKSRRSLFIQITGPQTFMAAESYAVKAFLRSLFKLPTGDLDLDSMPQEITDEQAPPRKSSYAAKQDGVTDKEFNKIRLSIGRATSTEELRAIHSEYADKERDWAKFPARYAEHLQGDFDVKYEDLKSAEEALA